METISPLHDSEWRSIEGFPRYVINPQGQIYNVATNRYMRSSINNYGHPKISLLTETGGRHDRSVALLVAKTFLEKPNPACDRIIYLNGDLSDFRSKNLAWRPRWFGWKYARQLKVDQPAYYRSLPVINTTTDERYDNIIEAGMKEGLLFEQIWHSTYSGGPVYPTGDVWIVDG